MHDLNAAVAECRRAQGEGREISDAAARAIAAAYLSGGGGLAAEFVRTGAVPAEPALVWRELFTSGGRSWGQLSPDGRLAADLLGTYLGAAGPRGPVGGWGQR